MSRTENHFGILEKVEVDNLEQFCVKRFAEKGKEIPSYYKNAIDALGGEGDEEFTIINNKLYRFIERQEIEEGFFEVFESNGRIYYSGSFYNGGTCLEEMLEEGIEKLESK